MACSIYFVSKQKLAIALMIIELIYLANADESFHQSLKVDKSCTVLQALKASKIFVQYPELKPDNLDIGIFGQTASLLTNLKDGDRVEIYRPLTISPMDKRRLLARRKK